LRPSRDGVTTELVDNGHDQVREHANGHNGQRIERATCRERGHATAIVLERAGTSPRSTENARIPDPARFAVHKLLVAKQRPPAFQSKRDKDLAQAAHLIEALDELRPGELRRAWRNASARGPSWERSLRASVPLLARWPVAAKLAAKLVS